MYSINKGMTIESRWRTLDSNRHSSLERARNCAELTLPSLLPPDSFDESQQLPIPWQSLGPRAVLHLAAKLMMALFPPNASFFRYTILESAIMKAAEASKQKGNLEEGLASIEREISQEFENLGYRSHLHTAIKQMIAVGSSLMFVPDAGPAKVFRLDRFVIRRSPEGRPVELVTKEGIFIDSPEIPDSIRGILEQKFATKAGVTNDDGRRTPLKLFSHVWFNPNTKLWEFRQEVEGFAIPDTEGTFSKEAFPYIPLRWSSLAEENYGRGHVENFLGDFRTYEALSQAIAEGSAAAARLLFLVNPNSYTKAEELANTPNGGFATGRKEDVSCLQMEKYADFQIAFQQQKEIESRLSSAFLLNSSIQRNAERVTAEEIRFLAGELESALGGIYTLLSAELQLPLVKLLEYRLKKAKRIPELGDKISPVIITGLDGLGRTYDLQKYQTLVGVMAKVPGNEQYINVGELWKRSAAALNVSIDGLIKTEEEMQAEKAQQMQSMMAAKAIPNAVGGAMPTGMPGANEGMGQ